MAAGASSEAKGLVQTLAVQVQEYESCLVSAAVIGDYRVDGWTGREQ